MCPAAALIATESPIQMSTNHLSIIGGVGVTLFVLILTIALGLLLGHHLCFKKCKSNGLYSVKKQRISYKTHENVELQTSVTETYPKPKKIYTTAFSEPQINYDESTKGKYLLHVFIFLLLFMP